MKKNESAILLFRYKKVVERENERLSDSLLHTSILMDSARSPPCTSNFLDRVSFELDMWSLHHDYGVKKLGFINQMVGESKE